MTRYFAVFEPDDGGWLVTFPDVPEAITGGVTEQEAVANAEDALEVALLAYAEDGKSLPDVSFVTGRSVDISASVAVKIAFMEAFRMSGMTRVALGERLGKHESEVRRMLDPRHKTKLAAMEAGLRALGKQLVLSVKSAA